MNADETIRSAVEEARAGKPAQAEALYRQVLAEQPDNAIAHYNLGNLLARSGRVDEAIKAYRSAIALQPQLHEAHNNLGQLLAETGRLDEALPALDRAAELDGEHAMGLFKLANRLFAAGHFAEAESAFRRVVAVQPDAPLAHTHLGQVLLLRGELTEGWREHEWRPHDTAVRQSPLPQPRWDGAALNGRRILLYAEQGFGDAIQFARYVPMVAERGGKIIVECQSPLLRLIRSVAGAGEVISQGRPLGTFDVQCPLMSLPLIFGTTLQTIPRDVPYVTPDPAAVDRWRARLAPLSGLKVGLVWAGGQISNPLRTIGLPALSPLAQVSGVRFISLLVGADRPAVASASMEIIDWTAELTDFADTAALMQTLDLIITIDSAPAHLAGALGKSAWVLLPWLPDWRWMLERDDSPWYPTVRLFRKPKPGDWTAVVQCVAEALRERVRAGGASLS